MLETETECVEAEPETLWADVAHVCHRIPPLWDLRNYVAVNPFLGFAGTPLEEAARIISEGLNAQTLPAVEFYRRRWAEGGFGQAELAAAARRRGYAPDELADVLADKRAVPRRVARGELTFAERHDLDFGTDWTDLLRRSVARWCAVHALGGGANWGLPGARSGLYVSWLEAARVDRSLEIAGLRGWRAWALRLPDSPEGAIDALATRLPIPQKRRRTYLYRLLGGLYGWASYLRRATWAKGGDELGELVDLTAILLAADAAVAELPRPTIPALIAPAPRSMEDESVRLVFQEALEDGFVRTLLGKLAVPQEVAPVSRPAVQAVFCIDVRSEPMRRHLEAQSAEVETLGFAGFFGVSLDWRTDDCGSARCPVLLKPGASLRSEAPPQSALLGKALKHVQIAPAASFSFVETLGLGYAARLASDMLAVLAPARPEDDRAPFTLEADAEGSGFTLEAQLELAAGILKNMSLPARFARLVLLCGHEAHCANNPHAAGLDCGACGGHGGAINARVAAAILNDRAVRAGLAGRGWQLPDDTHFLPAVHNTSTDVFTFLDAVRVPASHAPDLARLRGWLEAASTRVRQERAATLGLDRQPAHLLGRLFRRRTRDWAEVRPEWGLARNAAFIAARRVRSRGINLEGRTFLHEYDAARDPDNSVLSLILSAPMVVASWINLQYFASTIDNDAFGCGTKTIHNRVGAEGVVLGNGGDLRTGLPLQSVCAPDGRWFHEPLRLQVVVEAPPARIEAVLAERPQVRELVENGWVRLFALESQSAGAFQRYSGTDWRSVTIG